MKVKRIAQRRFGEMGGGRVLIAPAEYAIYEGGQLIVRIVRMGDGWRACRPTENSQIGIAVSPIGMNGFREVRDWAMSNTL